MNGLRAFASLAALACALAAGADARSDGGMRSLREDSALLLLPIFSDTRYDEIEFQDEGRDASFVVDDIEVRSQVVLVKVPPGTYHLRRLGLTDRSDILFGGHERRAARFTLRGGVINYAGDLELTIRGGRYYSNFGGNSFDLLPALVKRERRIDATVLERLPFEFALPLDGARLVDGVGASARRHADWVALVPQAQPERQHALATAVLERFGGRLPALGTGRKEVESALAKLSKKRIALQPAARNDQAVIALRGLWGDAGQPLGITLSYADGKLVLVAVRGLQDNGIWSVPARDAWDDLAALTAH